MKSCRSAFSIIELLVVMAVIAVLAVLSLGIVSSLRRKARAVECAENLRQLGASALLYAADHEATLPATSHQRSTGGVSWTKSLQDYAGGTLVFRCPADEDKSRVYSYVINDFLTPNPAGAPTLDYSRLPRLARPPATMLFGEASAANNESDHFHFADYQGQLIPAPAVAAEIAVERHAGAAHYVFADGHLESISWPEVQQRLRTPGNPFIDPTAGE